MLHDYPKLATCYLCSEIRQNVNVRVYFRTKLHLQLSLDNLVS